MKQHVPKKIEAAMPPSVPGYAFNSLPPTLDESEMRMKLYPESVMLRVEKILDLLVELGEDQAVRSNLGSLYEIGDRFYGALLEEINRDLPVHRGGPADSAANTGYSTTGDL